MMTSKIKLKSLTCQFDIMKIINLLFSSPFPIANYAICNNNITSRKAINYSKTKKNKNKPFITVAFFDLYKCRQLGGHYNRLQSPLLF